MSTKKSVVTLLIFKRTYMENTGKGLLLLTFSHLLAKIIDKSNVYIFNLSQTEGFHMDNYVNAGRWFSILYRRSQQFIVEACQRMGLTFSEFTLLVRIHDTPGVKQDDLAKVLFLDKAVVTRTINSLEQKGFIVRSQDKLDKRVKHVYLSVEAESYYPFLHNVLKRWMDYLCEGMKKKDVEKMETLFQHLTGRACEAILPDLAKDISEEFSKEDWQHELEKKEQ